MYEYGRVPGEGYIRRLVLEPGSPEAPLSGRLEAFSLQTAHEAYPFEAISYMWGSTLKDQSIIIDGKLLRITTSAGAALRQVRHQQVQKAVWMDSICINQVDLDEKGQQVALMGDIYKKSKLTWVCLGSRPEDQKHAQVAADFVSEVDGMIRRVFDDPEFSWGAGQFPKVKEDDPIITDDRWKSWVYFVSRPWFGRGWVVQEAALGREVCILWAGFRIRRLPVFRICYWLYHRAGYLMMGSHGRVLPPLHMRGYEIWRPREAETFRTADAAAGATTALEILNDARLMSLTNQKDRIYAFMALPTAANDMPTLQPDYSDGTSHLDIYRKFAIKYLEKASNLDILSYVRYDDQGADLAALSGGLPTWAPRWDIGKGGTNVAVLTDPKIHAEDQQSKVLADDFTLQVKAILFDSVKYACSTAKACSQTMNGVQEVSNMWQEFEPETRKWPGPHPEDHVAFSFLGTLTRGAIFGDNYKWSQSVKRCADLLHSGQLMTIDLASAGVSAENDAVRFMARKAIDVSCKQRLLLLGRGYFGLGPAATREGDVCAIIHGMRGPVILRRLQGAGNEQQYHLVGPVYVQSKVACEFGLMVSFGHLPGTNDWEEWGLLAEEISLR